MRVLFDSGCGDTIVNLELIKDLEQQRTKKSKWSTKGGSFKTNKVCNITFMLPLFHKNRDITWKAHVDERNPTGCRYDLIVGRDLMTELGMDLKFSEGTMVWDNAEVPMQPPFWFDQQNVDQLENELFMVHDPSTTDAERIQKILDIKHQKADLNKIVEEIKTINSEERQQLKSVLSKFEDLFDGSLGCWDCKPVELELKDPQCKPIHAKPYPVPQSQEMKLKEEVERLVKHGVLRKVNHSEWASPAFTISKPDGTLRSLTDNRAINKVLKRYPYPLPKIQDILQKLEGFQWATALDLTMGYYHIRLSPFSSKLCTVIFPWGKYEYLRLPMGLSNSPDIFQEKMSELMQDLEFARAYLDDLLVISKGTFLEHLEHIEKVLTRLSEAGLKVNISKSTFCKHDLEYLGYYISRKGIQPITKKVEAILKIATPTKRKEVRSFLGMVNFYRDMWPRRSEILAPLTALTSSSVKWKWTEVEERAFQEMKRVMARETLLAFPDFSKQFTIHTDASKTQLGSVISQEGKPIAFYSRKLNPAQTRYTTTERELLSIVETLKEFRNILFGQKIAIYTDHENLVQKSLTSDRVMRWRLYIEEYSPELIYLKGVDNHAADAISRLPMTTSDETLHQQQMSLEECADCMGIEEDPDWNPITFHALGKEQQQDVLLKKLLGIENNQLSQKIFHGGGIHHKLWTYKDKIVVPIKMQKKVVEWYHNRLLHPGHTRTEETISQHFWWPKLRDHIREHVKTCPTCQKNKRKKINYGHLPPKEAEIMPWDKMCIDLIGPYKIRRKAKPDLTCNAVTMIDPATGWFELHQIPDKRSDTVADIAEREWFCRYPWPTQITYDRGNEFLGKEFQELIKKEYGITRKPITVRNPQANAIVERVHQTIGNMIRTFELENNYLEEDDPWKGILAATAFAVRATIHTTLQKTPAQLVFGRDMILNVQHIANWEYIKQRKQTLINKNNNLENLKRKPYKYHEGDKVLLKRGTENKYESPYEGPYSILKIHDNGTVRLQRGAVTDTVNIRRITPFFEPNMSSHGGECNRPTSEVRRSARLHKPED